MIELNKNTMTILRERYLTLDELAYLASKYQEEDWGVEPSSDEKAKLVALGYITRSTHTLTNEGYSLIGLLRTGVEVDDQEFEEFFTVYPIDDAHGNFPKSCQIRGARTQDVKEAYREARTKGTREEILTGLKGYIAYLKSDTKTNSLKYMKRPLRFLREEVWRDYIEVKAHLLDYGTGLA